MATFLFERGFSEGELVEEDAVDGAEVDLQQRLGLTRLQVIYKQGKHWLESKLTVP